MFGYAQNTTDIVFLIAVDHSRNIALWKYISRHLLQQNTEKVEQGTITLHFDDCEQLNKSNLEDTIGRWQTLLKAEIELFSAIPTICQENESLRQKLLNYQNPQFTITSADGVKQIQIFTDQLNYLLDNDFSYIKKLFYLNVWKRGVAIFEYTETDLSYALYSIKYGENSLLIKELPLAEMKNQRGFISRNCAENRMHISPEGLAMQTIKNDFDTFIKYHRVLPPYEDFIVEYICDFIKEYGRDLGLDRTLLNNITEFILLMEKKYHHINEGISTSVNRGNRSIPVDILYGALKFLANRGYTQISNIYPEKSSNGNTGYVCDLFSIENARTKAIKVLRSTIIAYDNFIQTNFPLLYQELDLFFGADLVLINIRYTGRGGSMSEFCSEHHINVYYFRRKFEYSQRDVLFSFNEDSVLYKENVLGVNEDFFQKDTVYYRGRPYEAFRRDGIDMHKVLWDKYNITNTFYYFIEKMFTEYFKKNLNL